MELAGLDPKSRKHVGKYSMGMRQRLGIAQAMMEEPELLLLDEPFNGLDQSGVEEMRALFLEKAASGVTILLASHHGEDIDHLCHTVHRMESGVMTPLYASSVSFRKFLKVVQRHCRGIPWLPSVPEA